MHTISTQVPRPCLFTLAWNKSHRALTPITDSRIVFRTHNGLPCLHFPNFTWYHYVTRRNSDCYSLRHVITLENISLVSLVSELILGHWHQNAKYKTFYVETKESDSNIQIIFRHRHGINFVRFEEGQVFWRSLWHSTERDEIMFQKKPLARSIGRLGKQYARYCAADSFHLTEYVSFRASGRIFLLYVITRHYFYLVYRGIVVFVERGNFVYTKLQNFFLSKNKEHGDIINNR